MTKPPAIQSETKTLWRASSEEERVQSIVEVVRIQQQEKTEHQRSVTTMTVVATVVVAAEEPSPCRLLPPVAVQASRGRRGAAAAAAQQTQLVGRIAAAPAACATEAGRIRSHARTADRNSADGTAGSSRQLLSPDEDDESRPLYRPSAPDARPAKAPDAVAASPCLAAAGVVVPARLHQQPTETFRMTGRSWEDCQCELQIRDVQTY